MRIVLPWPRALGALAASAALACGLGSRWENALVIALVDGMALYGQASDGESTLGAQRLRTLPGAYSAAYSFQNFNEDDLAIDFQLGKPAFAKYESLFGYYQKDLDEIKAWHQSARQGAYQYALKQQKTQQQLDTAYKNLQAENDKRVKDYMALRGFRILSGNVVTVDMPILVKRNGPILNSLAQAFDRLAVQRGYDSENLIGAATSLVQTAMIYREPPAIDGAARHTGGILQPATALVRGWGDCDTKTGLLASLLSNWPQIRMVGVGVPGHYLMGVLRIPNKDDAYVEYQGMQYVLIEPAGPAWLMPGSVAATSVALLENDYGYRIDPFF